MSTDPMPPDEERSDLAAANVVPREGRQPRWLMPVAVAFCAASVLVGVLLAIDTMRTGSGAEPVTHHDVTLLATVGPGTDGSPVTPVPGPGGGSETPTDSAGQTLTATADTALGAAPTATRAEPDDPPGPPQDVWIIRSVTSSLCLGTDSGGKPDDTAVRQVACGGANSQRWRVVTSSPDVVALVNVASGKCLGLGSGRADRAAVQQEPCADDPDQLWRVTAVRGDQMSLRSVHSDGCLEAPGDKPGSVVRQATCDGRTHQQWTTGE